MDALVLAEKLEALRHCAHRIESKRAPTVEALREDPDRQDILALNLTRAVQLCVDMALQLLATSEEPAPATMGEAFEGLRRSGIIDADLCAHLKSAVGFRNVAVHSYQKIDWDIVHAITWQHLDDFRRFARAMSAHLPDGAL